MPIIFNKLIVVIIEINRHHINALKTDLFYVNIAYITHTHKHAHARTHPHIHRQALFIIIKFQKFLNFFSSRVC